MMKRGKRPPISSSDRAMNSALEYLYKRIDKITPSIYAAFALALNEKGWTTDEISDLFARTQVIWQDALDDGRDMIQICSDELDIDVRSGNNEY